MEGSRNSVEKIAYRLRSSFNRRPQKFRDTLAKTCGALLVIGCFLWGATATYGSERAQENGPEEGSTVSASPKEEAIMVILHTNYGDITLELYPDKAPNTVSNFLRYVDEGFYNGTIFHRVIDGFMIQGGGLTPDLHPKQTHPPIPNEATNGLKNLRGTVAMARTSAIDSATSQFFINVVDNSFLDHTAPTPAGFGYCVFGKVVKGMDVVDKIKRVPTTTVGPFQNVPVDPVIIISASRLPETSAP